MQHVIENIIKVQYAYIMQFGFRKGKGETDAISIM